MSSLLRALVALAAGVAAGVSFEPFRLVWLLPVAVAALVLVAVGRRARTGFALGALFGTAFMLTLLPWMQVIGPDAWVGLSVLQGLFYGLLGATTAVVAGRLPGWPLAVAAAWVGVETLRGTGPFGGFPWGRLGFATVDTPVADLFPLGGAALATFAVALVGTVLAWAVLRVAGPGRRTPASVLPGAAGLAVVVLLAAGGGLVRPDPAAASAEGGRGVRVAAVQGDVPGEGMDIFSERRVVLDNHVQATLGLADRVESGESPRPDLVIWPENSTDINPFADPTVFDDIQRAVDAVGVPVLVGAMVDGPRPDAEVFNQGIVWEPGTGPGERYSKRHPVPFGEYIPFRDALAPLVGRLDQIPRDMVAGDEPGVLAMNGTTIGDVICFEVAYDDVVRDVVVSGAEVLVVQTNNATYMGTGQVEQQFAISRLRALETGLPVVVAATNGISGLVGPDGGVVQRAPVRATAVLERELPAATTAPPALRWGRTVEVALGLGGLAAVLLGLVLRRRAGRADPEQASAERGPAGSDGRVAGHEALPR